MSLTWADAARAVSATALPALAAPVSTAGAGRARACLDGDEPVLRGLDLARDLADAGDSRRGGHRGQCVAVALGLAGQQDDALIHRLHCDVAALELRRGLQRLDHAIADLTVGDFDLALGGNRNHLEEISYLADSFDPLRDLLGLGLLLRGLDLAVEGDDAVHRVDVHVRGGALARHEGHLRLRRGPGVGRCEAHRRGQAKREGSREEPRHSFLLEVHRLFPFLCSRRGMALGAQRRTRPCSTSRSMAGMRSWRIESS
jgi:hypothetical protein